MGAGTEFEQKILAGPKNVKFNFINATDPYHKYYQYKIIEAKEGEEAAQRAFADDGAGALSKSAAAAAAAPVQEAAAPPPTQELKKPDDEKYTAHIPPGLTFQELETIKLTAQFVARNGMAFLTGLRSREDNKREFMFLKETHSLNTFFKRLTDAYSAVLFDAKEALTRLHGDVNDSNAVLQRCACVTRSLLMRSSQAQNCLQNRCTAHEIYVFLFASMRHGQCAADQVCHKAGFILQVPAAPGVGACEGVRS